MKEKIFGVVLRTRNWVNLNRAGVYIVYEIAFKYFNAFFKRNIFFLHWNRVKKLKKKNCLPVPSVSNKSKASFISYFYSSVSSHLAFLPYLTGGLGCLNEAIIPKFKNISKII